MSSANKDCHPYFPLCLSFLFLFFNLISLLLSFAVIISNSSFLDHFFFLSLIKNFFCFVDLDISSSNIDYELDKRLSLCLCFSPRECTLEVLCSRILVHRILFLQSSYAFQQCVLSVLGANKLENKLF